jgi:hypothetical protein
MRSANLERFYLVLFAAILLCIVLLLSAGCGEPSDEWKDKQAADTSFTLLGRASTWTIPHDIAFVGDTALVSQGPAGVLRFDVADPSAPMLLDSLHLRTPDSPVNARQIRPLLQDWNRIVIAGGVDDSLEMYEYPTFDPVGQKTLPGTQRDLFVYSYTDTVISTYDQQMRPARVIQFVAANSLNGLVKYVWHRDSLLIGDEVWPNDRYNGSLQVSGLFYQGEAPERLGKLPDPGFVAAGMGDWGIVIADIRNEDGMGGQWIGQADTPGEAGSSVYQDGYLYVADGEKGLAVLDVSDYYDPAYVRSWHVEGMEHAVEVAVRGHCLVLADQFDGLYFFDITEPGAPELIDQFALRNTRSMTFKDDDILGVVADYEGMTLLELRY